MTTRPTLEPGTDTTPIAVPQDEDPPFAVATLHRGKQCNQWVVKRCPLCRQKHFHGAGAPDQDPRDFLGHRVGHCSGRWRPAAHVVGGGYVLVEGGTNEDR